MAGSAALRQVRTIPRTIAVPRSAPGLAEVVTPSLHMACSACTACVNESEAHCEMTFDWLWHAVVLRRGPGGLIGATRLVLRQKDLS